ncbi:MAG: hypothetical protein QM493_08955 [Sulfurovum sp.]
MKAKKIYSTKNITKVKSLIKDNMIVEDMLLYKYSEYNEMLDILCDDEFIPITLENSFLEYTIESKRLEFDNHIKSNKYYTSKFDNPKDLTIRGLLMFPIIENKKTIGVLSMYRSAKQNINFTNKDEITMKSFEMLLCKLIHEESIDDDDLLVFDSIDKEEIQDIEKPVNRKRKKELDNSSILKKSNADIQVQIQKIKQENESLKLDMKVQIDKFLIKKSEEIEALKQSKKELEKVIQEYTLQEIEIKEKDEKKKIELEKLTKELKKRKANIKVQNKDITLMEKELEKLEEITQENENLKADTKVRIDKSLIKKSEEIEALKKSKKELEKAVKGYSLQEIESKEEDKKKNIELANLKANAKIQNKSAIIMQEDLAQMRELKQDNEDLRADIKDRNSIILKYSNNEIKEKHVRKRESRKTDQNIEYLLKEIDCKFGGYKNSYILFEMMIYAISSLKGMNIIEDFITKSKDLNNFVDTFYREITIKPKRKKEQIKKVFEDKIKDNLSFDESLPSSLVVDTPKINSILYHIQENLAILSEDKTLVYTNVSYHNEHLLIEVNGKIKQESGILQNIFKKTNTGNEQELMICDKLVKLLGGSLNSSYNEEDYQYKISLPAKIIDLNFV